MGNIGTAIKRFFSNKNTVTLLAIVVCTVILYLFYNNRVTNAVKTTYACYATKVIPAREKITQDMVSTMRVLSSQVSSNMVTDCGSVIGKYASYATEIPANSYFYASELMTESEMPDSAHANIPDGFTQFNLSVTFQSTYGNSIFPGNYIDLYVRTTDASGLPIFGKFIQSIQVLGVIDANGKPVFESTVESRTPSQLLFAVPEDLFLLLSKAQMIGIELVIVPRNSNYTATAGDTLVSSDYLKQLILDQTASIPDECVASETGTAECRLAESTTTNTDTNNTQTNQ